LIINGYSSKNKGDSAIVLETIRGFAGFIPPEQMAIATDDPNEDSGMYSILVVRNLFVEWAEFWLNEQRFKAPRVADRLTRREHIVSLYAEADLIVSCGGGYLHSFGFGVALMIRLLAFLPAVLLRKKIVVYPQSIGPFERSWQRGLCSWFLKRTTMVFVREETSLAEAHRMGIGHLTTLAPDISFLMEPIPTQDAKVLLSELGICLDRRIIGFAVRDWGFGGRTDRAALRERYVSSLVSVAKYLAGTRGFRIVFFPQVTRHRDNDIDFSQEVVSRIGERDVYLIDADLTPAQLAGLYGLCHMFVGTRMHANIFAILSGVPVVAIEYLPKTGSIMKMLGCSSFVLGIDVITETELKEKVSRVLDERDSISCHLRRQVVQIRERARVPRLLGMHEDPVVLPAVHRQSPSSYAQVSWCLAWQKTFSVPWGLVSLLLLCYPLGFCASGLSTPEDTRDGGLKGGL
jgi:colanic acid/amylovoran biosynthesis protein